MPKKSFYYYSNKILFEVSENFCDRKSNGHQRCPPCVYIGVPPTKAVQFTSERS